ncbi:aurora kinase-like isoform X1, partial [Clarias magur]
ESDVLQWDEKNPDPLMRTNMEKDRLMKYIREKCQECLLHLDEPEEQFSYFFWLIMERCCNRNGRAMMVEFSVLLFKGYGLLMRKLGYVHSLESWCLPLAKLLCSKSPRDKQREDVIMMGDDFASKGWIYPAQICYVVAQMELGLRPHFQQAGSESYSVLKKVIEKTEVYKYTESLTSGFGQSHIKEEESKELRKLCWLLEGRTEMFISRGPESQDVSLSPPEWSQDSRQFGDHATLWGLGFLYELVREDLPCCSKEEIVEGHLSSVPGVSDASKGWISPAQSFYMVAQIDLESRHVKLVQFVRLPASKSSLKKVTEGTELHKYALSLISGFSQSQFRDFRVLHTWKLFGSELDVGNCESISTTVLTLPYVIESSMIKWITRLSENLIQPKEEEEPEELRTASEDVDLPEFHPSQH